MRKFKIRMTHILSMLLLLLAGTVVGVAVTSIPGNSDSTKRYTRCLKGWHLVHRQNGLLCKRGKHFRSPRCIHGYTRVPVSGPGWLCVKPVPKPTTTTTATVPTTPTTTATTPATTPVTTPVTVPTTAPTTTGTVDKVLVFVEENHSLDQMKAGMPYLYGEAQKYGYATNYTAITHPSLGNYLAFAFGSDFGVRDDAAPSSHPQTAQDVFTAAIQAGRTAKSYQESMTGNCAVGGGGGYAVKHNPWAYASSTAAHTACLANDIPSGSSTSGALHDDIINGTLPNVGEVTPNLNNDAHDGSLGTADNWFKGWLTLIYASPDWKSGHLAVIIIADEDSGNQGNKVLTVVIHPSQSAKVVTTPLSHYSLTGLLSQVGHSSCIANGCSAASFAGAFGLTVN